MQVIIIFLITILFILDILIISCSVFSNAICIFVTKFISGNRIYSSEGMHALLCMLLVLMRPWRILCYKCIAAFWKRSFLKLSCFRPITELYEFPHCFGKIKLMCPLYWFGKSYIFFHVPGMGMRISVPTNNFLLVQIATVFINWCSFTQVCAFFPCWLE